MATLYEYYNTGDDSNRAIFSGNWYAQTFTPATAHKITSVKLKLYRAGSPGTLTVGIRATDGSGHPTGGDLCSGTTDGNTLPLFPSTEWREITLGAGYNLSASIKYAIVARIPGGNISNSVRWAADDSSPTYAGGNLESSVDSGSSWTSSTIYDLMFEDWGEPAVTQKEVSDTGSGVDATPSIAVSLSLAETGAGVDAVPALSPTIPAIPDEGLGTDLIALIEAALSLAETGSGVDAVSVNYYVTFINVSDVGEGADVITLAITIPAIEDSGVGVDQILGEYTKVIADQMYSSEWLGVAASMILSELAEGADNVAVQVTPIIEETGQGLESIVINASLNVAEVGSGQEAITITATIPIAETGAGVDAALAAVSITIADTGQGVDAILKRVLQLVKMLVLTRNKARMTVQTINKARITIQLRGGGQE